MLVRKTIPTKIEAEHILIDVLIKRKSCSGYADNVERFSFLSILGQTKRSTKCRKWSKSCRKSKQLVENPSKKDHSFCFVAVNLFVTTTCIMVIDKAVYCFQ